MTVLVHASRGARSHHGSALFVTGVDGVGKSCLAAEVVALARAEGMVALSGRGSAIGPAVPFRPLAEALSPLARYLDRAEVLRLTAACLRSEPAQVSDHVVELLWRDSAGSPPVVGELVRKLVDSGQLVRHRDEWQVGATPSTIVPAPVVSVPEALLARLTHSRRADLAGRRALADSRADAAVALPTEADDLPAEHPDVNRRNDAFDALVCALGETGQFERAFELSIRFAGLGPSARVAVSPMELAWACYLAGRYRDGLDEIAIARASHGGAQTEEQAAAIDAVHANLVLEAGGPDGMPAAEKLARDALTVADRLSAPEIACRSLQVLGIVTSGWDADESRQYFEHARQVADDHRLPLSRVHVLARLGRQQALSEGDTRCLQLARAEAPARVRSRLSVVRTQSLAGSWCCAGTSTRQRNGRRPMRSSGRGGRTARKPSVVVQRSGSAEIMGGSH